MYSAICNVFSAAPLRIWSPQTHKDMPLSLNKSFLIHPIATSVLSDVSNGIGYI